jgi:hypothetical protein
MGAGSAAVLMRAPLALRNSINQVLSTSQQQAVAPILAALQGIACLAELRSMRVLHDGIASGTS